MAAVNGPPMINSPTPDALLQAAAEEYAYNPDTPTCRSGIRGETSVDPEEAFKAGARWQALRPDPATPASSGELADELRSAFPGGEKMGVRLSDNMFRRILAALSSTQPPADHSRAGDGPPEQCHICDGRGWFSDDMMGSSVTECAVCDGTGERPTLTPESAKSEGGIREAALAVSAAINRARDMVPDEDDGLSAEIFAFHLNHAQDELDRALRANAREEKAS